MLIDAAARRREKFSVRLILALALSVGLVLGSAPADADSGLEVDIHDISGDANALVRDTPTPVSYPSADLVSVDLQTPYEAVPVGENGIDYQPKELRVVFEMAASPGNVEAGSQLVYRVVAEDVNGFLYVEGVVSKSPTGTVASTARLRKANSQCSLEPDSCWSASKPEWTAQINASQKTLTLTFPFSSLVSQESREIGIGEIIWFPEASTLVPGTDGAVQDVVSGRIDTAPFGHSYVVGAEVPEDVDCAQECEHTPLSCFGEFGWSDNGWDEIRFVGGGDEACESAAEVDGVKLTLTARRCPSAAACTETQVVKECPGRRCVADLYVPYSYGETAGYTLIVRWEFGDGRVSQVTVSGLCHSVNPLEDCPESVQEKLVRF